MNTVAPTRGFKYVDITDLPVNPFGGLVPDEAFATLPSEQEFEAEFNDCQRVWERGPRGDSR